MRYRIWKEDEIMNLEGGRYVSDSDCSLHCESKWVMDMNGQVFDAVQEISSGDIFLEKVNNCVVEPYTGLKDEDGYDVFVGDIVEITGKDDFWFMEKGDVKFKSGVFVARFGSEMWGRLNDRTKMKIVGNIHER